MTVFDTAQVVFYEFPGHADPGLPIGAWAAQGNVTGDASAGSRILDVVFAPSTQPRNSLMYSLEQLSVLDESNTSSVIEVSTVNLGQAASTDFSQAWAANMVADTAGVNANLLAADAQFFRGLFLGRSSGQSVGVLLRIGADNIDTEDIIVHAEGYMWGVRSLNAPGGPRRPVSGLYRA